MLYYYDLLKDLAKATTTSSHKVTVGWFSEWDKKRRISVEQLREILKQQGSPWAKELEDVVEKAAPKSKKHAEILEEVLEEIPQRLADPVDWNSINLSLQAAAQATRATAAIKHAESALSAIRTVRAERSAAIATENDDEEAIMLLLSA